MNFEKIFDIRFLAPPGILILLLYFLLPEGFKNLTSQNPPLGWMIGIVGILTIGFLVSSITESLLNVFGKTNKNCYEDYKCISDIKELFPNKKDDKNSREIAVWKLFEKMGEGINRQVHKRWGMANANFNACVAITLAWSITWWVYNCTTFNFVDIPSDSFMVFAAFLSIAFSIILSFNGVIAYFSVLRMQKVVSAKFAGTPTKKSAQKQLNAS